MKRIGVAAALALALAGCGSSSKGTATPGPPPISSATGGTDPSPASSSEGTLTHLEDAKLTGCTADPATGNAAAQVHITNTARTASDLAVEVAFSSADGKQRIAVGTVVVGGLQPGESADDVANGLTPAPAAGYRCKVIDVTRTPS